MIGKGIKLCMCALFVLMGVEAVSRYGAVGLLLVGVGLAGAVMVLRGRA